MAPFFRFGKAAQPKKEYDITLFPIFTGLSQAEIKMVEEKIRLVELKKGECAYQKGEAASAFYVILTGRFQILRENGEVINHLHHGDYFGETSIITDHPHSATVQAKNDSIVLKIEKNDFLWLLKRIPALSLQISRTLGHRLTSNMAGEELEGQSKILSIYHAQPRIGNSTFAVRLAASLAFEMKKKVIVVDLSQIHAEGRSVSRTRPHARSYSLASHGLPSAQSLDPFILKKDGPFDFLNVSNHVELEKAERQLAHLLSYLLSRYHYILIDLPAESSGLGPKAIQQSDLLYFLVDSGEKETQKTQNIIYHFKETFSLNDNDIRLVLVESKDAKRIFSSNVATKQFYSYPVFATLPHVSGMPSPSETNLKEPLPGDAGKAYSKVIRFLAREVTGTSVGLVLGSGAAFGFAHIGVLKALEEAGIEIDILGGCSMGSLIGGMWALGITTDELVKIATDLNPKNVFFKLIGLQDLSIAHRGFFKGDQVTEFLREHIGNASFRDVKVPIKVMAADLANGNPVVLDEGSLLAAIRASISIPGIFRPFQIGNRYLMDGGVVDPLPVQMLRRYGAKKVIAVNVLQSPDDHANRLEILQRKDEKTNEIIQNKSIFVRHLYEYRKDFMDKQTANIFNVVMKAIQFMEFEMAENSELHADVVLRPIVTDAHWAEFYHAEKFIRRGEDETLKAMDEIKRMMSE